MKPRIKLTIGRRFDNREKGESDDSPLAWELHRKRGQILHEELEKDPTWTVVSWGETDDTKRTHEDVTVLLELAEAAKTVAFGFAGAVLYKVLEDTVVDAVKKLIKKFVLRLRKKEVRRAYAELPNGATVEWTSPGYANDVDIWLISRVSLSTKELEGE
jgi:hypothetical protein